MKIIAVEEHFYTQEYLDYLHSRKSVPRMEIFQDEQTHETAERFWQSADYCTVRKDYKKQESLLTDTGAGRLSDMERAGITMQVLSLSTPGVEPFRPAEGIAWARKTNNELAAIVKAHPDRFAGLAALPFQDPPAAAAELERCVKELGLKGAKVNSHVKGEYLDAPKYRVIFQAAERLEVPVYIHPREPSPGMIKPYLAYPRLADSMWGFGAEVSLHAVRLICSGLFDECPRLKIILGHMGEGVPFWLWRLDNKWANSPMGRKLHKTPGQYFKDNFLVSTAGMFSVPALMCTIMAVGADNILFAVDYPMESNAAAVKFIESAPISPADKEKILHGNAEKLLGI